MIKILKKIGKILLGLLLSLVIIFSVVYFLYNEKLPKAEMSVEADLLAQKMLKAVHHDSYEKTQYIEWSFAGRHHYKWNKQRKLVEVKLDDKIVQLNLQSPDSSSVKVSNSEVSGSARSEIIEQAIAHFNNDSFWLVATHKVFDPGTERGVVALANGDEALLVTYTAGGSTQGDSYLWLLDETGLPVAFKMWVSIFPIGGVEATWESWQTAESGALFPSHHKFLFLDIPIEGIKARK